MKLRDRENEMQGAECKKWTGSIISNLRSVRIQGAAVSYIYRKTFRKSPTDSVVSDLALNKD
jgi:hypothetical protein